MAIIYLITNKITNKQYIGMTARALDVRWNGHVRSAKYNSTTYLHASIRKHGPHAFTCEIIENCDDKDMASREMFWIDKKNTFAPMGYNLTKGGDGVLGLKYTQEMIERNRMSQTGKTQSKETCKARSDSMLRSKNVKRVPVKRIDVLGKIKTYKSICDAERDLNKPGCATLISRCCQGKTETACGFRWEYVSQKACQKKKTVIRRVEKRSLNDELIQSFSSIAEATRSVSKSSKAIGYCCQGKIKTAYGFKWNFESTQPNVFKTNFESKL